MIFVYPFEAGHVGQLFPGRHGKAPAVARFLYLFLYAVPGFGRELLDKGPAGERRCV
jgi:hypothetical protein